MKLLDPQASLRKEAGEIVVGGEGGEISEKKSNKKKRKRITNKSGFRSVQVKKPNFFYPLQN